jgi:hypothetical protein
MELVIWNCLWYKDSLDYAFTKLMPTNLKPWKVIVVDKKTSTGLQLSK